MLDISEDYMKKKILALKDRIEKKEVKAAVLRDEIRKLREDLEAIEESIDTACSDLNDAARSLEDAADSISQYV